MSEYDDDPEMKAYFMRAKTEMFPKLKDSALSITILDDPDPKLCLELGAAILFDKPIVFLVPEGRRIPSNVRRVASAIIEGDPSDPETALKFKEAVRNLTKQDRRS